MAQLADYDVTAPTLADFQAKIAAYNGSTGQPRTKQSTNSAAGALLDAEIELANTLLDERIDGLMQRYKTESPSFFGSYQAARRVVDNASGRASKDENQPQPQPA